MHNNRDDYEPIIADRRPRAPLREETQPLWRLVLALGAGLVVVILLAWWFMGRSSDSTTTSAQSDSALESFPEERVEQAPAPPARDSAANTGTPQSTAPSIPESESNADIAPSPTPPVSDTGETTDVPSPALPTVEANPRVDTEQPTEPADRPEGATDESIQPPPTPSTMSVHFKSPDSQVRFELRGQGDAPSVTSKAGDVIEVAPGTYRVTASGPGLETFEQDVTFDGGRPAEYSVELCAEPKQERESVAGQVVDERTCASTTECESMFMILSEYADQLVKDRAFRSQQCAKWRANASPDGRWTLNTDCGGATLATTCRIEITEGACTVTGPRRSARDTACPRGELM